MYKGCSQRKGISVSTVSHPKGVWLQAHSLISQKVLALKSGSLKHIIKGIKREELRGKQPDMLEYLGAVIAGSCSVPSLKRKEEVVAYEACGENCKGESWLKAAVVWGRGVTTNFQKPVQCGILRK